jgi:hypothetical protein
MQRIVGWILWSLLGLVAVACTGSAADLSTRLQLTTPSPEHRESQPTATLAAPRKVYIPTEFDLLYYPTDLNIVGITGRPQFINAYADW